jgi:membrane protein DedA with SNARE-associated domain
LSGQDRVLSSSSFRGIFWPVEFRTISASVKMPYHLRGLGARLTWRLGSRGEKEQLMDITDFWMFLATFGGLVAAGIGVPIPEELPIVGAGIWAASDPPVGAWKWFILPTCILGVVISDGLLYGVGRMWGRAILERPWVRRVLPAEKRERIEKNFDVYGVKILLFARVLPGIRSPIFIMAGVMRLPLKRFIFADGIYAIPGVSLLFFLSYWIGDQFKDLVEAFTKEVNHLRPILILIALLGIAAYMIWHFWRKPVSTGDPKELPRIIDKVVEKHSPLDSVIERLAPRKSQEEKKPGPNGQPPGTSADGRARPKEAGEKAEEPPREREGTA